MKKRLLFVVASLGVGGAQKIAAFVMNSCVLKYDIYVYSLSNEEINVDLSPAINIYYENTKEINRILEKVKQIKNIKNIIKTLRPDLVVLFGSYSFPAIGAVMSTTKILGCERGDPHTYSLIRRVINKILYKKYDYSVFQSDGARDFYSINNKRSRVICNPCFPVKTKPIIHRENLICAAGRLSIDKGFDTLLHAFHKIKDDFPEYKLIIYGEGPYKKNLQKMISDLKLDDSVILYGKVRHLPEYIQKAKLFVLSSWYEGLPNVLIEAMSVGTPIVSTDCSPGGARFLMNNGKRGGIIVPIKNSYKMASAIRFMLMNRDYAEQMGEKGKEIISLYSPDLIAKQWNEVIERVLEG